MKKISIFLALVALVMTLFAITVFADEVNIASEATVTTPTNSWWITGNLDRLTDGNEGTGMHSSCHDRETTVNFKFDSERTITKIVMKVNGTATTTAQNKENLNANTDYKVSFNGETVTVNALDKTELVIEVNAVIDEFSIWFISNWSGDNALIREVEVYEYVAPVVEAASGNNIEDEATITITDGNDYIKGGVEYLIDNDPSTGLSAGNAADWINYHFLYTNPRAITKVKVVVNSTGTMYMVGSADGTYVHETMSNLQNIYLRLYDAKGVIYQLEKQSTSGAVEVTKDGKTYMEYTFDLGGARYEDVVKVEVATLHNKDVNVGVWEVEIIDFQCQKDEDHIYNPATCSAPATCKFCGATTGEPSGEHTLLPANCGQPIRCKYCDYTEGDVTGNPHTWVNASYTAPKTCIVCGTTEGDVWVDSELPGFVRGPEGDKVTYDDIVGEVELIAGSTGKGDPANVLNGTVANVNDLWGGPTGSQIKITLKHEWEITSVNVILASNWASLKISFYAADGTLLGELNKGGLQDNTVVMNPGVLPEELVVNDFTGAVNKINYDSENAAVKYIVISNTGDKWGWAPAVMELYLVGRERIPYDGCRTHTFEQVFDPAPTCLDDGTLLNRCTVCGGEESPVVAPALGHDMAEYTIKVPATCITAPILEFVCTRCGETTERDPFVQDVTDYGDVFSIVTNGAGAETSSHLALFDNNMNTVLMASGGWYVESEITLDMYYYITSVTVWVGRGGAEAKTTFSYWDAETESWVAVGYEQTPVVSNLENKYTYELPYTVYANRIKIRVDNLNSHYGVAYEAEVAGSILPETAAGHTWATAEDLVTAPGCESHGYTLYVCEVCYAEKNDDFVKPTGHNYAAATCTAPKTCTVCAATTGDPLGHGNYVAGEQAEDGSIVYSCERGCGDYYVVNNVVVSGTYYDSTGMEYVLDNGILVANGAEYTYTNNVTTGMITTNDEAVFFSVVDGALFFKGTGVALHQHNGEYDAYENEDGTVDYVCNGCGTLMYVVNNAAVNGTYYNENAEEVVFDNGALAIGDATYAYEYNVTDGMINTDADGIFFQVLDGKIYFRGNGAALHQHNDETPVIVETIDPTCTDAGANVSYCAACGAELASEVIEPIAHTVVHVEAVEATCFEDGNIEYWYCESCGYAWLDEACTLNTNLKAVVLPMAHNAVKHVEAVEATCFEDGNIEYWYCESCGYAWLDEACTLNTNLKAVVLPMADHQYFYPCDPVCMVCHEITNPDATHTIVHVEAVVATCTANGNVEYWYCSDCGTAWTDEALTQQTNMMSVVVPAAHTWAENPSPYYYATPTCVSEGKGVYYCEVCYAESEEVVIPVDPAAHNWDNMVYNSTFTYYTCNDCKVSDFSGMFSGIGNDYTFSFYDSKAVITDADWTIVESYTYTVNGTYGIFTLNLTPVDPEMATFAGMARITFNANDEINIGLQTADALYFFGTEYLRGSYEFCPEEGSVLAVTFQDGMVYVLCDTMGVLSEQVAFPYVYNYSMNVIDTEYGYFYVDVVTGDLCFGRGWVLSPVDYNAELEGEYEFKPEEGASLVVEFANGMIYVLEDTIGLDLPEDEGFAYTYNPYKGTIETNGIGYFYVDVTTGDLYFGRGWLLTPVQDEPEEPDPEDPVVDYGDKIGSFEVEITDNDTWVDLYTYTATAAGQYSFYLPAGLGMWRAEYCDVWPAVQEDIVDYYYNAEGAYLVVNLEADEVFSFYVASKVKDTTYTIDVYYYTEGCTHVEVEIPAVLPTPSTVGMTAGTMCSECGEILVAPVEVVVEATPSYKTFGIGATDLVLGNNISLNYKVNVAEGYNNPYMVFVFEDKEYVVTEYTIDPSNGRLVFNFAETRPHKIAENIKAYVYGETENGYAVDVYEYSVMKYCESKLKKNEAVDVISDLLVFGSQTQKYVNPDVADEDLITTIVESHGFTLTPSTFTSIPAASKAQYVDVDEDDDLVWKSSTVVLGASSQMVYKFVAEDITGLYIKIEVDGVEKMMIDASELEIDPANGRYVVSVNCVSAVQYGSEVKATFVRNGVESDSVSYSINGFLYNNLAKNEGTTLGNLMKALYMYGATTYNYIYNK